MRKDNKKCVKIMNVETKIDCQPPKISLDTYYDPGKLERNARRVLEIDKENMELLKRLYIISLSRVKRERLHLEIYIKSYLIDYISDYIRAGLEE